MERIAEARHTEWPISTLAPCHKSEKKNGDHLKKQVLFYVTVIEDIQKNGLTLSIREIELIVATIEETLFIAN